MKILEYASPEVSPPRWRARLYSFRFVFLTAYIALVAAAIALIPDWPMIIGFLVMTGLQGIFLMGSPQLRWPRPTRRRSIIFSQMSAAVVASMLTFGVFAAVLNIGGGWDRLVAFMGGGVFLLIGAPWVEWCLIFAYLWARQPHSGFTKTYKLLIAGTVLETLITIPIDVQVRKRTNCWCDQGTFWALVIGTSVAIWSFGPGLILLFLTRRLQREGYFALCAKCGQDLSAVQEPRCPACNARIPRNNR